MDTKETGFAFFDRSRITYIFVGLTPRGKLRFLTHRGSTTVRLDTKGDSFWEELTSGISISKRCLYYFSLRQCVEKYWELYKDFTWRSEAKRIAYGIMKKRVVELNFDDRKSPRKGYVKKDRTGFVSLVEICSELKLDPVETRKHLRNHMKKPGGRWEWPLAEKESIMKKIKSFFK